MNGSGGLLVEEAAARNLLAGGVKSRGGVEMRELRTAARLELCSGDSTLLAGGDQALVC